MPSPYECWIVDRSLRERLVPLGFGSLNWGRTMDDASTATVAVPTDRALTLRDARPWRHGVGVWRDRQLEWIGPIVSIKRPTGDDTVTVTARDIIAWTMKRFVRKEIDFELADLSIFFDLLIQEAARRDNPFNLTSSTPIVGVAGKRSYTPDTDSQVFSAIQELARTGMDFTVWRDQILSGPTNRLFSGYLLLGAEAFQGTIGVELDGMAQGNSQRTAAGGTGGSDGFTQIGEYENWDPSGDGLLESFETEALIKDAASAQAASRQRWEELHATPQSIEVPPLSPLFPGTMDDLIPGKLWRLQYDDPLFDIAGDYRLTKVDVSVSIGGDGAIEESIKVELQGATG